MPEAKPSQAAQENYGDIMTAWHHGLDPKKRGKLEASGFVAGSVEFRLGPGDEEHPDARS